MGDSEVDPKRFQLIDQLLDAVFELEDHQIPAFLDQACAGDKALRTEIERLIASDKRDRALINSPAFQAAAGLVQQDHDVPVEIGAQTLFSLLAQEESNKTPLSARTLIAGRYELLSRLGKGGMGEVWHAYDVKLRVDVALKSLRFDFKGSQDPLEFLRREVRTAREVISTNVCRIFDLVSEEEGELISMEHIDGITLMEMMVQKGPLELRDARDIAAQFLTGLDAIHAAGLVHRDLKPENIMITRSGRVVVMDLGIAQPQAQSGGMISGTLPYMSPEQLRGEQVDARGDIFSAGVVLAEMIYTKGTQSKDTREIVWQAIRKDPMQLPDSPWKEVIARAVAENKENRFESATALARALEEITVRAETIEDRTPYPGLSSFSSGDSEYFFGREQEVESLIKKLHQLHLMALIGPSGAGKTSFLQAGLIPALPEDWGYVLINPGGAPMVNLQQGLTPLLSGDEEANARMIRFEEPDTAIWILSRVRHAHKEFVLIVDRFEELFTLSSSEVQSRFAEFLARATLESNIRVLLVMRDDFFILCKEHLSLAPIFSELTGMLPLTGAALRRALVQPALKCGYKFEDETLVHDILSDVEKERGALPLLAFAASLLWERRDRSKGLLTRLAYKEIGEVRGALAQHAENTMQHIGVERETIVREIFRNLITVQKTRVARDVQELLSVFDTASANPSAAQEVLRVLIDARLLTSFEDHIEITHESLIINWPRLVKWQAQDAESAQLRDELRQAAQLWAQRGRTEDLLWTGEAFLEFQLWRQRYPGGLTATENAFAQAMTFYAGKKRRRRRFTVATIFVVLLMTLVIIWNFWHRESIARKDAVAESKRAEASKVLAIGRGIPNPDPSTKLAYAIASLEFADSPQARRFALQALSEGPPAKVMEFGRHTAMELSPDGKWIAAGRLDGGLDLFSDDGTGPISLHEAFKPNHYVQWKPQFSADSKFLIWTWRGDTRTVKVWSLADKKVVRTFHFEGLTMCLVRAGKAFFVTDTTGRLSTPMNWGPCVARVWNFDHNEPEIIGHLEVEGSNWKSFDIDSSGRSIAYVKQKGVYTRSLTESGISHEKLIGLHNVESIIARFHPSGNQLASVDLNGELRLWSLTAAPKNPIRTIAKAGSLPPSFDPKGRFLLASREDAIAQWDLTVDGAEPVLFRSPEESGTAIMDQQNRWLVVQAGSLLAFYPARRTYPYAFRDHGSNVRFLPDGKSLIGSNNDIFMWSIPGENKKTNRTLWNEKEGWGAGAIDVDRLGKHVLTNTGNAIRLISIPDGKDLPLKGNLSFQSYEAVAFSPDGKSTAAIGIAGIEIWDLQSDNSRILKQSKGKLYQSLKYSPDGTLFSGYDGAVYRWNLKDGTAEVVVRGKGSWVSSIAISHNGRYLVATFSTAKTIYELPGASCDLVLYDLKERKTSRISSHGNRVFRVAFDSGSRLITGDLDGIIRVGPITGETPHLLLGHSGGISDISVDPHGIWLATSDGGTVRLWRMPDGKSMDALPYSEFLDRLRSLTNVRAIVDQTSPTGYRTKHAHFPGWKNGVKQ